MSASIARASGLARTLAMKTPKLRVSVPSRAFHASARRLQPEIDPKIVSNPGAAKPKPESQQEPLYDESRQSDSWQYDPSKDPMLKLSPEELKAMKKDIDQGAQRAFSIGYGVLGAGMLVAGIIVFLNR